MIMLHSPVSEEARYGTAGDGNKVRMRMSGVAAGADRCIQMERARWGGRGRKPLLGAALVRLQAREDCARAETSPHNGAPGELLARACRMRDRTAEEQRIMRDYVPPNGQKTARSEREGHTPTTTTEHAARIKHLKLAVSRERRTIALQHWWTWRPPNRPQKMAPGWYPGCHRNVPPCACERAKRRGEERTMKRQRPVPLRRRAQPNRKEWDRGAPISLSRSLLPLGTRS
jgi:hypothetical protein